MAEFRVIAGDFGQGAKGDVRVGKMWKVSAQGLNMPIPGHSIKTEHIAAGQIEILEIATQENLKKMAGSIGWGFLGGLALGPIGALAGVLAGGRKTEVTFICQFKDGRKFLGQSDPKTYADIQAARFVAPQRVRMPLTTKIAGGVIIVIAICIGVAISLVGDKSPNPTTSHADRLDQPAVKLVTFLLTEDMNDMLVRDRPSTVWPKIADLLSWLHLAWSLPATNYEAEYDANEIAADNDFKGQPLLIFGTVSSVSKDFADEGYVVLRGAGSMGIRAQLSDTGATSAASFKKGQQVNLVCIGGGRVMTIATLERCESLDDYLNGLKPSLQDQVAAFLSDGKALGEAAALPIVSMYVKGLHMPHNSPCLNGKRDTCKAELRALLANKAQSQAIQAEAKTMLASLKMN